MKQISIYQQDWKQLIDEKNEKGHKKIADTLTNKINSKTTLTIQLSEELVQFCKNNENILNSIKQYIENERNNSK